MDRSKGRQLWSNISQTSQVAARKVNLIKAVGIMSQNEQPQCVRSYAYIKSDGVYHCKPCFCFTGKQVAETLLVVNQETKEAAAKREVRGTVGANPLHIRSCAMIVILSWKWCSKPRSFC